ncbi:MAG TPA: hypothetical protein VMV88_06905 [Gallionella sp.]|nr:hypothetical protein [Gallionella sp.]
MSHPLFDQNRVILCHFDSYSAALVFARFGSSILASAPLPESAAPIPAPGDITEQYSPDMVLNALEAHFGINPEKLNLDDRFQAWMSSTSGPIRIHLVRFTTLDAPHQSIELFGGVFKPISEMRKMPMIELNLMRQVFNQIMGGG